MKVLNIFIINIKTNTIGRRRNGKGPNLDSQGPITIPSLRLKTSQSLKISHSCKSKDVKNSRLDGLEEEELGAKR